MEAQGPSAVTIIEWRCLHRGVYSHWLRFTGFTFWCLDMFDRSDHLGNKMMPLWTVKAQTWGAGLCAEEHWLVDHTCSLSWIHARIENPADHICASSKSKRDLFTSGNAAVRGYSDFLATSVKSNKPTNIHREKISLCLSATCVQLHRSTEIEE